MNMPRPHSKLGLGLCLAAFLAAAPLHALFIEGLPNPTVNERFTSGFPSAPVANDSASFLGAGLDFSGVGWKTDSPQFSLTLISPRHFLIAAHSAPAAGSTVSFLNRDGVVKAFTVDSLYTITHATGVNTDITIGRLAAPIASTDQITAYPILSLNSYAQYLDLPLLVYGGSGRVGQNTLDKLMLADMLPFGGGDGTEDSVLFRTDLDPVNGQTQGEVSDSGAPSLYIAGSTLALVGVHSAIDTLPDLDLTYDSFIPSYAAQINDRLALDGYTLHAIPEPATTAAILGLTALAGAAKRQRAARRTEPQPAAVITPSQ